MQTRVSTSCTNISVQNKCSATAHTIFFFLTELPTPLKKRRLSPLDACMSEGSTPYGSPCATPTRVDQSEAPATPVLLATPPRPRTEEPSTELLPSTPTQTLNLPQEVKLYSESMEVAYLYKGEKELEGLCLFLCAQSESSVESSPEVSRKPSSQEVRAQQELTFLGFNICGHY